MSAEIEQDPVDEAEVGLNSQYHSRLDTPSPMTTGTKTIARVNRRERRVRRHQQGEEVAADRSGSA